MIFELASETDFEAVNRLAKQVTQHHAQWDPSLQIVDETYPLDFFRECIQGDSIHSNAIYVARQNGEVVGFMRFYLWQTNGTVTRKRTMIQIDDIGVEESLRNRGIGQRMMAAFFDLARSFGCDGVNLYVDAPNESAIAFYQKCGLRIKNHGMSMTL